MASNLLIVESPAKATTLKKYLGQDFEILATYGHVRDLMPKAGAIDPEHDFAMQYEIIARNSKHIEAIIKLPLKQITSIWHRILTVKAKPLPTRS